MLKKKSLFFIAMALVCALTVTACGKKEETKANDTAKTSTEEKAPAEENKQEADVIGRTIVPWMNGWSAEVIGIYDRYENLIPQIILLVVTIASVIYQNNRNKKIRAELEASQEKE